MKIETLSSEAELQGAAPDPGPPPAGPATSASPWTEFARLLGEAYRLAPLFP